MSSRKNNKIMKHAKSIKKRLRSIRGSDTLQSFAKKIGVAHTTVMRYERGMIPSPKVLMAISRLSGKSIESILTDKNEQTFSNLSEDEQVIPPSIPSNLPEDEFVSIPLTEGKIAAGEAIITEENIIDWVVLHIRPIKKSLSKLPDLVACRVSGYSMYPQLAPDDIVIIDRGTNKNAILKGRIYALWNDGGLSVKLIKKEGHLLRLISINKDEEERTIDLRINPMPIVGLVIGAWKNFC